MATFFVFQWCNLALPLMGGVPGLLLRYRFQIVGDAFCAAFPTAADTLQAALAAQHALLDEPWGDTRPLRVRMALQTS